MAGYSVYSNETGYAAMPPLQQVLARGEHEFIDALIELWRYCDVNANRIPSQYKMDQEELVFGDARYFPLGYRYQLFTLAEGYYAARLRRDVIKKADDFYHALVLAIRTRRNSTVAFYHRCHTSYNTAWEGGVSKTVLRLKIKKAARVTRYFSALKLWKDCTSPDPDVEWLQPDPTFDAALHWMSNYHFNSDDSDNENTDKESTVAQASQSSDG